jgi:hypothetical protein
MPKYPARIPVEQARDQLSRATLVDGSVEWIALLLAAAVVLAGVIGLVAALAAGESDSLRDAGRSAEAAIFEAGFSLYELHLLAAMAAVARADLRAETVEVVLREAARFSRDGIVVTGSRLGRGRAAARVVFGAGLAGRAMASGHTTLEGLAAAVPITGEDGTIGVVLAVGEDSFDTPDIARLDRLAADIGHKLAASLSETA